jgi:DNA end-binding protein Ku
MAMRSIGSATVSFGLVSVPISLYSVAESAAKISFNWIHKDCGSRVKQKHYCPTDDKLVDRDDLVKGYQFAKDQYVLFNPDEIKALDAQATNTIDIVEFIPLEQVERIQLSRAYYLGPDKGGERAYRLLSAALRETGRAALASYAARGKQHLVLVRPIEDGLLLEQLHYADELRPFSEVPLGEGDVKDEELKLAVQLIEQAASDEYHPEKYEDDVRQRVMSLIEEKIQGGKEITAAPSPETETKVIDLMEALKASLGEEDEGGSADAKPRKGAKRAASRAKSSRKKAASGG